MLELGAGRWVIVILPTIGKARVVRTILAGMLPTGSYAGGRTFQLPSGGRVSIMCASDNPPNHTPFEIRLLYWDNEDTEPLTRWRL